MLGSTTLSISILNHFKFILRNTLPFLICTVIIIVFFNIVIKNAVDIPNGDDLYCLLLFTQNFQDAAGWQDRFSLLIQQWVEHRIVYSRLTSLISFWIHGQVNFVTIILIGNLTLVGFTLLFWKLLRDIKVSAYYLIPVVLTLFSPVTYEANMWAGASTVYMPVCFLALLTVYLLTIPSPFGLICAGVTSILAAFSFGNGMFSFIAGLVVLLCQRKYKESAGWLLMTIIIIPLYFYGFEAHSGTNAFSIKSFLKSPEYLFYNLFGFLGGTLDYLENVNAPIAAGNIPALVLGLVLSVAAVAGVYFFFLKKTTVTDHINTKSKITWLGMVVFLGITAITMAYARTSGESMNTLSSRYKIYSMIAFILVYWGSLMFFRKKTRVAIVFGSVSLVLLLFNYYVNYEKLVNYKSNFLSGLYNYRNDNQWVIYRHTSYYEGASLIISDSIKANPKPVYDFYSVFPELTHFALNRAQILNEVQVSEDCAPGKRNCVQIKSANYPHISNFNRGIYLVVYNDQKILLFLADPLKNGRFNMLTNGNYFKDGFNLNTNFGDSLTKGASYKLAIFCPTEKENIRRIDRIFHNI